MYIRHDPMEHFWGALLVFTMMVISMVIWVFQFFGRKH